MQTGREGFEQTCSDTSPNAKGGFGDEEVTTAVKDQGAAGVLCPCPECPDPGTPKVIVELVVVQRERVKGG